MINIKKQLGKRIKELRKQQNISQEQLAESVGIEPNNISRIENGKNYPTAENLAKIANCLNIDIYKLFVFNHHKPIELIKQELYCAIEDESFARQLYKYYQLIKE